jgi:hypothetical protein
VNTNRYAFAKRSGHQFNLLNRNQSGCPVTSLRSVSDERNYHASAFHLSRTTLNRLLQGAAIGAVASIVVGFSWGGWMTGGTADRLAAERADTAVVAALTPVCVERFLQNGDAQANLAAIKQIPSNWQQGEYVQKGGWATQPGATSSDYHLARACAEKLTQAKTAAQ